MPSFSLNSSSDEYDADDRNSGRRSKANREGKGKGVKIALPYPTLTARRGKLPQSEKKQIMKDDKSAKKPMPVAASRMTLRSSSKKKNVTLRSSSKNEKNEEGVLLRRSQSVSFDNSMSIPRELSLHNNRHHAQLAALYPPRPVKTPPKCPVGAIQLSLPFHLFGDTSNSNELLATLINFREPRSYTDTPPISPSISLLSNEHSGSNKQTKQLPPTPFYSHRPLSVHDLDS